VKVYLAGPDVFLPDAAVVLAAKREECARFGLEGLAPTDNEGLADGPGIFRANVALMDRADVGVFNLSPFRGPSADVGTVFELGYLFARGKPVFGYTGDAATFKDRVLREPGQPDGLAVEDFGLRDNLMIDGALLVRGVFVAVPDASGLAAMAAFRRCLEEVARRHGRPGAESLA